MAETRKNLWLKRPGWVPGIESLLDAVEQVPTVVFSLPVPLAHKDVPLLCTAIRSECTLFVTGDNQDFGALLESEILGVTVVSPLGLARRVQGTD